MHVYMKVSMFTQAKVYLYSRAETFNCEWIVIQSFLSLNAKKKI